LYLVLTVVQRSSLFQMGIFSRMLRGTLAAWQQLECSTKTFIVVSAGVVLFITSVADPTLTLIGSLGIAAGTLYFYLVHRDRARNEHGQRGHPDLRQQSHLSGTIDGFIRLATLLASFSFLRLFTFCLVLPRSQGSQ
jgi:hypothetical protein